MIAKNIHVLLSDCPPLRVVSFSAADFFTGFSFDDNAVASDEQAVAKWLFTPGPDNVPKVFRTRTIKQDLASEIAGFKARPSILSWPAGRRTKICLSVDLDTCKFNGKETIQLEFTKPTNSLTLHAGALEVETESLKLEDGTAEWWRSRPFVTLRRRSPPDYSTVRRRRFVKCSSSMTGTTNR
ncbi:hypothetical protein niasHT_035922 [Heterodera trifolii]|uniref:Uncharacterized protein n=1 Tax=Heterodera trifolii TaxID=157864 RepID=A0ABD2IUU0_9BILA